MDPSRGAPSRSNDAGPDHGARDDTADLTVGGDASAALDGPTPPGSRERGLVVSTMDSYGFVRCEKRTQDIFFHFSEVIRPGESAEETASLERPVSNGDSVECHIVRNNKTSKLNAVAVALLPPGSVTLEALLPNVFLGKVTRSVTSRRDKGSITLMGLDPSSPA